MTTIRLAKTDSAADRSLTAKSLIAQSRSSEVFFAVVGPVGAGSTWVMDCLARVATAQGYECVSVKASELIRRWAEQSGYTLPPAEPKRRICAGLSRNGF